MPNFGQLNGVYRFSFKSHVNKWKEDWGLPLLNLPSTWVNLCVEGILHPGHIAHTFFRKPSSSTLTTFDLVASFNFGQLNGVYRFSFKSHVNKRKEDWGVPLPNLPSTWVNLCVEGILHPGHVAHTFFRKLSSSTLTTFDLVASFVSAYNLHCKCPPSLLKALADSHPDCEIWLESFCEEKRGIEALDTYKKISLG